MDDLAVEACRKMLAVFENYGFAINDLFGHDEEFLDAWTLMRKAVGEDVEDEEE